MGANVSKTVENITNNVSNTIDNSASASANATCAITTGNIILKNSKNSTVTNENKCGASASAALDAVVDASANAFMTASNAQKTNLLPGVNVNSSLQDVKNEIRNQLNQKCQANSSTTMEIANGDITIEGSENCHIKNLNFGDAVANCGIRSVINATLSAEQETNTTQETGELNLMESLFGDYLYFSLGGSALSSCLCCCCCMILIIGIFFMMSS
jgi:hypothetical protein